MELRLLVENSTAGAWTVLPIPAGPPLALSITDIGGVKLSPATVASAEKDILLEVLSDRVALRLLVISFTHRLHVNGLPAPTANVLTVKDVLRIGSVVLHVTTYNRVKIAPVDARQIGTECPVCRGTLTGQSRVLTCCQCGCGIHLEENAHGLQCALAIRSCPACSREIHLAQDTYYSYLPEGFAVPGPEASA